MPVIRVAVRVAALEIENEALGQLTEILADEEEGRVTVRSGAQIIFSSTFDKVQRLHTKAARVYEVAAAPVIQSILDGNDGILVCLGTLSSGKAAVMNALPPWAASGAALSPGEAGSPSSVDCDSSSAKDDIGDLDLPELALAPRVLYELLAHAEATGQTLTLSVYQIYFETIQDLLADNAASTGNSMPVSSGEKPDTHQKGGFSAAASQHTVSSARAGIRLLASAQLCRARTCVDPGAAHVVAVLTLCRGGQLLLLEGARLDAVDALGATTANASLHALTHCLTSNANAPAKEATLVARLLRPLKQSETAVISVLVCTGSAAVSHEVSALRLAQKAKGLRSPKGEAKQQGGLVDFLQEKLERLIASAVPSADEAESAMVEILPDAHSLAHSLELLREERAALEAEVAAARGDMRGGKQVDMRGGKQVGRQGGRAVAPGGAAAETAALQQEEALLREELERQQAEMRRLVAATQASRSAGVGAPARSVESRAESARARSGSDEQQCAAPESERPSLARQISAHEQSVHSAWEDMQSAQQQADALEDKWRRSRAASQHSAHAHEEMEATLLEAAAELENLARGYRQSAQPQMAVPLHAAALAMFEKTLGAEHAQVASNLVNLGNALCDQNKHSEAVPAYLRALAIDEKTLGENHPEVAMDLSNLGIAYRALGRPDIGRPLFERAHKIMLGALGPDDPKTKAIAQNMNQGR